MNIFKFGGFFILLLISSIAFGQDKVGHINSAELLKLMPEVQVADAELQKVAKQLEDQEKMMLTEYQRKIAEFQAQQDSMMPSVMEMKYKELEDMQMRIQKFQQKAQEDIMKKKEALYAPILTKAEDSIKAVAKENGYKYILDSSMGSVLFAEETDNILPLVKQKLNLN